MMGRTHALPGLVAGVAAGHFWWHLDAPHLAVAAAVTAGAAVLPDIDHPDGSVATRSGSERWVVAPAMVVALGWLVAVIAKVLPAGRLPLR